MIGKVVRISLSQKAESSHDSAQGISLALAVLGLPPMEAEVPEDLIGLSTDGNLLVDI